LRCQENSYADTQSLERINYVPLQSIYGVCPKGNRTFFLKHLLISLQLNKTYLLQSTLLHCLYTASNVFSQFWNAFCGIARRSHSEFSSSSSIVWNRRPFREDFNFGNKRKSAWAKSGE
jgi:hypothetical protein